jgi:hypothetical protein
MILVVRDRQTTERKSSYWLAQVPAMALALLLAGLFFADERWLAAASAPAWGIGYLVFLPLWLRWAAGAAILATALAALRWSPARPGEGRQWRPSPYRWAAVPGMMLLFWLLREQTWHGDALYKLQLLAAETLQSNPYVWKEPLDSFLQHTGSAWAHAAGRPPEMALALSSVFAGGVYVSAVLLAAGRLAAGLRWRWWCYVTGLAALGSSLLWFGHIENYSWSTALAFAAIVAALGHVQGRAPLGVAGLLGGAAVSFHPQAAFALGWAVALLPGRGGWRRLGVLLLSGLAAPLATVGLLGALGVPWPQLGGGFAGDSQLFWTPAQALAPAQLGQALQNLWLVAPLWPFWLAALGLGLGRRSLRSDRQLWLLLLPAAGLLCYFLFFQNDLPRYRDWDLYAILAPPLTLAGLYAWLALAETFSPAWQLGGMRLLIVGLAGAALLSGAWVGVNAATTLLRPTAGERALFARFRLADLSDLLPQATITPPEPLCAEPAGCERVMRSEFVMPQNGDSRTVLFAHAPAAVALPLTLPDEATFLWLSPALDPQAWGWGGDGVTFAVKVRSDGGEAVLWQRHLDPAQAGDLGWQEHFISLAAYRGQSIELVLVTEPGPAGDATGDRAGWGLPWLMRGVVDARVLP